MSKPNLQTSVGKLGTGPGSGPVSGPGSDGVLNPGAKRYFVLLRGLNRGRGHWLEFETLLRASLRASDQVVLADLPGNGELYAKRSPTHLPEYLPAVRDQVSRTLADDGAVAGNNAQLILVAVSMGAMLAVEWARQFPEEIAQCFLMNTSSAVFSPFYRRFLLQSFFPPPTQALQVTSNNLDAQKKWGTKLAEYSHSHPVSPLNSIRQLTAASQFQFPKAAPRPTILLGSKTDRLVSYQCSVDIAHRWGCVLETHPTAGHDITLDAPEWVVEQIHKYL